MISRFIGVLLFKIIAILSLLIGCSTKPISEKGSIEIVSLQDESRPIKNIFISEITEHDGRPSVEDKFVTTINISKAILPALNSKQKLFFIGSQARFKRLLSEVPSTQLKHLNTQPYTWLQDLFEVGETKDGPVALMSHSNFNPHLKGVVNDIMSTINVGHKPQIKVLESNSNLGTVGGNLEKWPGNIGVIGSSDFESPDSASKFAGQIFSTEDVLILPTSWLHLGHVDEVIKLLKYRPGPKCEIEVLINSPEMAISLLQQDQKELFLNEIKHKGSRIMDIRSIQKICKIGGFKCLGPLNGTVVEALKNHPVLKTNLNLITKELKSIKQMIETAYATRKSKCNVKWIEAPSLHLVESEDSQLKNGKGFSIFPSLTNGILINDTYIVADPGNQAFRSGFSRAMRKSSINVRYVPMKENFGGNASDGYLHCMTQVMRE